MPWRFDDESIDVLRYFNRLKLHLMPYLYDAAREAHEHGWPVMRSMVLEFPDDPTCRYLDTQFMLGAALLVAPVFAECGQVTYYLPEGPWRHLLSGESVEGPVWRTEKYGYLSLPLWVHTRRGAGWECLKGYATL
jgi:alpha-D-xyloside xylohydrolase